MEKTHNYTSAFGACIDDEISSALASGMSLELLYVEMANRTREIGNALAAKHMQRELDKCAA
jgi:hypothetical protein